MYSQLYSGGQTFLHRVSTQLSSVGRIALQIILLGIFLYFFGLPAIERFQARKVTDDRCNF